MEPEETQLIRDDLQSAAFARYVETIRDAIVYLNQPRVKAQKGRCTFGAIKRLLKARKTDLRERWLSEAVEKLGRDGVIFIDDSFWDVQVFTPLGVKKAAPSLPAPKYKTVCGIQVRVKYLGEKI